MAIFTCSECNFSKTVADEMAGKKARCPKCNAVNDIPLEVSLEQDDPEIEKVTEGTEVKPDASNETEPSKEMEFNSGTAVGSTEDSNVDAANVATDETSKPSERVESPAAATTGHNSNESPVPTATVSKISKGWMVGFAGAASFFAIGIAMFVMRYIDLSLICFSIGLLAFTAMAAMYSFRNN